MARHIKRRRVTRAATWALSTIVGSLTAPAAWAAIIDLPVNAYSNNIDVNFAGGLGLSYRTTTNNYSFFLGYCGIVCTVYDFHFEQSGTLNAGSIRFTGGPLLAGGQLIGSSSSFVSTGRVLTNITDTLEICGFFGCVPIARYHSESGPFTRPTNGYLGLDLMLAGEHHYGWLSLAADPSNLYLRIDDLIYETVANVPVVTGSLESQYHPPPPPPPPPPVPEPSSLSVLGTALVALGLFAWRRRRQTTGDLSEAARAA